jgi:NAD(P)-dependent dehydrogenase (short-subunit alcohol dehydrogenase family)
VIIPGQGTVDSTGKEAMTTHQGAQREHAIVAGGANGIGLQVVKRLLARHVAVTVFDLESAELNETFGTRETLSALKVDVTDAGSVEDGFRAAQREFGPATRLVVSAGAHGQLLDVVNLDIDEWQRLMNVHVRGALLLAQAFGRRVLPSREDGYDTDAAVVSVASTTGITASRKQGDYGPAKSAMAQLTRVLAMEWASSGVRANAVAPGMTRTRFVENMVAHGYDLSGSEQRTPLGRLATVDEVAVAVEFLLMDATYITGVVLPVDGGWTASGR